MIAPLRAKLQKSFEATDEDTAFITEMKRAFNNDFEKRFTDVFDLLYTASAIDPRFKTLPSLGDNEAERIFASLSAKSEAIHNKVTASGLLLKSKNQVHSDISNPLLNISRTISGFHTAIR